MPPSRSSVQGDSRPVGGPPLPLLSRSERLGSLNRDDRLGRGGRIWSVAVCERLRAAVRRGCCTAPPPIAASVASEAQACATDEREVPGRRSHRVRSWLRLRTSVLVRPAQLQCHSGWRSRKSVGRCAETLTAMRRGSWPRWRQATLTRLVSSIGVICQSCCVGSRLTSALRREQSPCPRPPSEEPALGAAGGDAHSAGEPHGDSLDAWSGATDDVRELPRAFVPGVVVDPEETSATRPTATSAAA